MRYPIVLDLETKYSFIDRSNVKDLDISVVGVYDYRSGKLTGLFEKDITRQFS